jgi:hypothetical protein
MCHQRRSPAQRLVTFVALFCLALVTACEPSMPRRVVEPAPVWRPCLSQAPAVPAGEMTVAETIDLLIGTRAALVLCDAQGRAVIQSWPR